jgi:regulation of enolase protein 1 (concanavalin A-like superfamily)
MQIASSAKGAVAVLLCLLLLPAVPDFTMTSEGGKVVIRQFPDGNATRELAFPAAGSNSSIELRIPKAATVTRASLDIAGLVYLENFTMNASTRDDFAACTLSGLDINSTPGDLKLASTPTWQDDFCGTALDQNWTWLNPPLACDVGVNLTGYLHAVSKMNTQFNDSKDDGSFLYQAANGSFYIETKILSNPQHDYESAGLMIRQDSGNWASLKYQNRSGQVVQFNDRVGGSMPPSLHDHLSHSPMYLRLEKDNRALTCYYSTDGVSWTKPAWSIDPITLTDPLKIGIIVLDGGAWTNYPANFDYFLFHQYESFGTMLSPQLPTARPVSQVRATWNGPTSLTNAETFISVRADPSAPWQRLFLNYTAPLNNPGSLAQYKVEMNSSGLRTPVMYDLTINFSAMSYPSDISLALGTGAPLWDHPGEFNKTQSVDFKDVLSEYLAAATPDGEGNVTVALKLTSSTSGKLALRNLTMEYLVGVPPEAPALISPAQDGFVSILTPVLNLSARDADNDTIQFLVELSEDGFNTSTVYNQTTFQTPWSNRSYSSGETAGLGLVYPLAQGRTYSWRARAFDGAYWSPLSDTHRFAVDTTPPAGAPKDEGNVTGIQTSLSALLDFTDGESGIDRYEYRIGTMQGAGDVLGNATAAAPNVNASGLSLTKGAKYYFTARARNGAGQWSDWESSDGIIFWPPDTEPAGIRIGLPLNGSSVRGMVTVSGTSWLRDGWGRNNTVQMRADEGAWKIVAVHGSGWSRDWSLDWDSRQVLDGIHVIRMRVVLGYQDGTRLASDEVGVNVTNNAPPPPPINITVTFAPAENGTLSIQEGSDMEFTFATNASGGSVTWTVDGGARPDEVYSRFVFRANYSSAGVHNISVTVQYPNQVFKHGWTLTVANINRPPVAAIFLPQPGVQWRVGDNIAFNASTTTDPDLEDVLTFSWELGDGTFFNGGVTEHAYKSAGSYKVTLLVTDGSLDSRAYTNVTVSTPETIIQSEATDELPLMMAAIAVAAVAASAGGYFFVNRHRRAEKRALPTEGPEHSLMARLPAAIHDEEEEAAAAPRETSRAQWSRLAAEAGPEPAPHPSPQADESFPGDVSFEDIPVVESVPTVEKVPAAPTARPRVPAAPPPPPAAHHPALPVQRPATGTRPPAPEDRSGLPMSSSPRRPSVVLGPGTRHPTPSTPHPKKPETLEDILAILNEK